MRIFIILAVLTLAGCAEKKAEQQPIKIGQTEEAETSPLELSMAEGKLLYDDFCSQCHMPTGEGVQGAFPPLAGSDWLSENREASIRSVKYGQQGEIVVNGQTYNGVMTSMGLSDKEVADVLNYAMNSWGNTQEEMITPQEVAAVEK